MMATELIEMALVGLRALVWVSGASLALGLAWGALALAEELFRRGLIP